MNPNKGKNPPREETKALSATVAAAQYALLENLIACELRFADLYAACADAFPNLAGFWASLSKEESEHASMLETMKRFIHAGHYFTNIGTLAKGADSVLKDLDHVIRGIQEGRFAEAQAFEHAILFESRLVDGHFYDVVKCGAPEFLHMASFLRRGAEQHRMKVHEHMTARRRRVQENPAV